MGLKIATKTVLSKYATFHGRAQRSELWYWFLALLILFFVLALIEGAIVAPLLGFDAFAPDAGNPLSALVSMLIFLPTLAVIVRRLHDIGRSGWWVLLQLIPIIGGLILLWWYAQPSDKKPNAYD